MPSKRDLLKGVTCESCQEKAATKFARVRRGEGDYTVRVCSGCAGSYEENYGEDVEVS